jgi:hypothetical protein
LVLPIWSPSLPTALALSPALMITPFVHGVCTLVLALLMVSLIALIRTSDLSSDYRTTSTVLGNWRVDRNGWVVARDGRLLVWIPHHLRSAVAWPCNTLVIFDAGSLQLPINRLIDGPLWWKLSQRQLARQNYDLKRVC